MSPRFGQLHLSSEGRSTPVPGPSSEKLCGKEPAGSSAGAGAARYGDLTRARWFDNSSRRLDRVVERAVLADRLLNERRYHGSYFLLYRLFGAGSSRKPQFQTRAAMRPLRAGKPGPARLKRIASATGNVVPLTDPDARAATGPAIENVAILDDKTDRRDGCCKASDKIGE